MQKIPPSKPSSISFGPPFEKISLRSFFYKYRFKSALSVNNGQTCPRCGSTEEELHKAVSILKQYLLPWGIEVKVEKEELSTKAPFKGSGVEIFSNLLNASLRIDINFGRKETEHLPILLL
jgi:hypothetical protein